MKRPTDSWTKIRDLRHTLIQYLLQQNRFGTEEDETIQKEEDVRYHAEGMPPLTDMSLGMRTDPLALITGATEFVTVIYGPAVTFAFPGVKVEAYRRSVLHLNLISAVEGSALNWCEQRALREIMGKDLLFAKISEPEMTVISFDDHFRDRMVEVDRGHIEVFPKLWNLRPYDKTNGEVRRTPRLTAAYHKLREETKGWGHYKKLPDEIPEFPLIRRFLLEADSVVQTLRLRAFETNERGVAKFSEMMDPCFEGRNAAVLHYTDTLEATTEQADEGTSTLEPPSAFMEMNRNLPESSSPSNSKNAEKKLLLELTRRRRIEGTARVPFLGTLLEEERDVHHRDHENRTEYNMDRNAFMEEVWTVVQSYGTQFTLKTGLNGPLMRKSLTNSTSVKGD